MCYRSLLLIGSSLFTLATADSVQAALVFAINGQEGLVPAVNLSQANPATNLTIQVRRDDLDSGGDHLASFAFRVRSSDASVAQFTAASLASPANLTGSSASANGVTATASGTYIVRPQVYFDSPGSYVNLATFTLSALNPGSVSVSIEEFSIDAISGGPIDFMLGQTDGPVVGQDRLGFSGNGTFIGTASTSINAISTVPEPGSILLSCAGLLLSAFGARRYPRRTNEILADEILD